MGGRRDKPRLPRKPTVRDTVPRPPIVGLQGLGYQPVRIPQHQPLLPSQVTEDGALERDRARRLAGVAPADIIMENQAEEPEEPEAAQGGQGIDDQGPPESSSEEEEEQVEHRGDTPKAVGGILRAISNAVQSFSPTKSPKNISPRRRTLNPSPSKSDKVLDTPRPGPSRMFDSPKSPRYQQIPEGTREGGALGLFGVGVGGLGVGGNNIDDSEDELPLLKPKSKSKGKSRIPDTSSSAESLLREFKTRAEKQDEMIAKWALEGHENITPSYPPSEIFFPPKSQHVKHPFSKSTKPKEVQPYNLPTRSHSSLGSEDHVQHPPAAQTHILDRYAVPDLTGYTEQGRQAVLSKLINERLQHSLNLVKQHQLELAGLEAQKAQYSSATSTATNETDRLRRHTDTLDKMLAQVTESIKKFNLEQESMKKNQEKIANQQAKLDATQTAYIESHLKAARELNTAKNRFISHWEVEIENVRNRLNQEGEKFLSDVRAKEASLVKQAKEIQETAKNQIDIGWVNAQNVILSALQEELAIRAQIEESNQRILQQQATLWHRSYLLDKDYRYEERRYPIIDRGLRSIEDRQGRLETKLEDFQSSFNTASNVTSIAQSILEEKFEGLTIQTALNQNTAARSQLRLNGFKARISRELRRFGKSKASSENLEKRLGESEHRLLNKISMKFGTYTYRLDKGESRRATSERSRSYAEGLRVAGEGSRVAAEIGRAGGEVVRAGEEINRQNAEAKRVRDEFIRESHLAVMQHGEQIRERQEEARRRFERERHGREALREAAELRREISQIDREDYGDTLELAEYDRIQNELNRNLAETNRNLAETNRNQAEVNRGAAENLRFKSEQERRRYEVRRVLKDLDREALKTVDKLKSLFAPRNDYQRSRRAVIDFLETSEGEEALRAPINTAVRGRTSQIETLEGDFKALAAKLDEINLQAALDQSRLPSRPLNEGAAPQTNEDIPTVGTATTRSIPFINIPYVPPTFSPTPERQIPQTSSVLTPPDTEFNSPPPPSPTFDDNLDSFSFDGLGFSEDGETGLGGSPATIRNTNNQDITPVATSSSQSYNENPNPIASSSGQPNISDILPTASTSTQPTIRHQGVYTLHMQMLGLSLTDYKQWIEQQTVFWPSPGFISAASAYDCIFKSELSASPYYNEELAGKGWLAGIKMMEDLVREGQVFGAEVYQAGLSTAFAGYPKEAKAGMKFGAYLQITAELAAAELSQTYIDPKFIEVAKSAFIFRDTACTRDYKTYLKDEAVKERERLKQREDNSGDTQSKRRKR